MEVTENGHCWCGLGMEVPKARINEAWRSFAGEDGGGGASVAEECIDPAEGPFDGKGAAEPTFAKVDGGGGGGGSCGVETKGSWV